MTFTAGLGVYQLAWPEQFTTLLPCNKCLHFFSDNGKKLYDTINCCITFHITCTLPLFYVLLANIVLNNREFLHLTTQRLDKFVSSDLAILSILTQYCMNRNKILTHLKIVETHLKLLKLTCIKYIFFN